MTNQMKGLALVFSFLFSVTGFSKVYKDIPVGAYGKDVSFSMKDCGGKTFLAFMMDKIYPAMQVAAKRQRGGEHIEGVKNGEGVEIKLASDVTTLHVKYKAATETNAERSGRSFGAVGTDRDSMDYVADASDSYYLSSLEKVAKDKAELQGFYETILGVVTKCDASGFKSLKTFTKQVAADFVAVYVAEEYRHLIGGRGKLGSSFNWDDALLQVTLLASFHSGQKANKGGMFYEGEFTDEVYDQIYEDGGEKHCVYRQTNNPIRRNLEKRKNQLNDYWQFNKECKRSGINLTRRDFTKMGQAITEWAAENDKEDITALVNELGSNSARQNVYSSISKYFINNSTPKNLRNSDELISNIVSLLMEVRDNAPEITESL